MFLLLLTPVSKNHPWKNMYKIQGKLENFTVLFSSFSAPKHVSTFNEYFPFSLIKILRIQKSFKLSEIPIRLKSNFLLNFEKKKVSYMNAEKSKGEKIALFSWYK